jgi:glucosylceramidase
MKLITASLCLLAVPALAGNAPQRTAHVAAVTAEKQFWQEGPELAFQPKPADGAAVITVDPNRQYQKILGFGAALTDAALYDIHQLGEEARAKFDELAFTPSGLNLSVCRVTVGASDYSRNAYNYDDTPGDEDMQHFSIDHDRAYIIPELLAARKANPELFLFSSPWSPPGWMKTSGSMLGGWMRSKYVPAYVNYYTRYLEEYDKAGVHINALTPQNEPETDQLGKMPATYWNPDDEMTFVRGIGPVLRAKKINTAVWIHDHNYDLWHRPDYELNDAATAKYVDGVAFHGYGGDATMMTALHAAHPDFPVYWTEGGPDLGANYGQYIEWGNTITDTMRNWAGSFTAWNLALDEQGKPNIGPFPCGGTITINSKTGELSFSGQYRAIGQFSRFVKRGAVRIASEGIAPGVKHVAFQNPDGGTVVVLTNAGEKTEVALNFNGQYAQVKLPAQSITTVTY